MWALYITEARVIVYSMNVGWEYAYKCLKMYVCICPVNKVNESEISKCIKTAANNIIYAMQVWIVQY